MTRSALRRYVEHLAIASLPFVGQIGCGTETTTTTPLDMQVSVIDDNDLGCPMMNDPCFWLQYVDFGTPTGSLAYWLPDGGGVDPCAPCRFETRPGVYCGQCQVVLNGCGIAYFCSTLDCRDGCTASGRRPPGLWLPMGAIADGLGAHLARMAHLEAASVPAFAQLMRELEAHGAPERLIAGVRRAVLDEQRHARMVGDLAHSFGARLLPLDVEPMPLRPLAAIALDNAVEGCVRETMGAAVAHRDARLFADPVPADAFASIAVDETRHANLAWAIDAWIVPRLSPAERRHVELARASAISGMLSSGSQV